MSIAGALAFTGTACNLTTIDPKEDTPDSDSPEETDTTPPTETPAETCLQAACPPFNSCTPYIVVRKSDLVNCYGLDENGGWSSHTPAFVTDCDGAAEHCTCDANDLCEFKYEPQLMFVDAACTLGTAGTHLDGPSFCHYPEPDETDVNDLIDQLNNDNCGVNIVPLDGCDEVDFTDVWLSDETCESCDPSAAARMVRPSGANVTLSLDPARSYLAVTTPVQSLMVRLSGDAFVDLPGNRLVGLKISAERVRFGNSDWNGFGFSLDKPVAFVRAGEAFRIPVAQKPTITATGRRDGALTRMRASSASDVTGHLSVAQKTWDLDFADQSVAGSFALHLVGRIQ
jgi:hypothetical protein